MGRIAATFERLGQQSRKALIASVTAGYPHAEITPALMHVLVEAGADIIELGMPAAELRTCVQPVPDVPGDDGAGSLATRWRQILDQVAQFRLSDTATPVVLAGPARYIEGHGAWLRPAALAEAVALAGGDGVLVFDPSPTLSDALALLLRGCGLDWIVGLAPAVAEDEVRQLAGRASGYAHGRFFTGEAAVRPAELVQVQDRLWRIRQHIAIPLGLATGAGEMETARRLASMADALIIGPWLAAQLADKPAAAALAAASDLFRELRRQLDMDIPGASRASKHPPFRR